jgi:hypothetical protein
VGLQLTAANQSLQAENVFARAAGQKAETLTGTLFRLTDANVVQRSQTQSMNREAATADLAGHFTKSVVGGLSSDTNGKDGNALWVGRLHETDGT